MVANGECGGERFRVDVALGMSMQRYLDYLDLPLTLLVGETGRSCFWCAAAVTDRLGIECLG